jgi:hypothetical protein
MTGTSDKEIKQFLADPENVEKFIQVAMTMSLGFVLTEDGRWVKLDT